MTTATDRTDSLADRLFTATLGALELYSIFLGAELGLYRTLETHGPCEIHRRRFVNVRRAAYIAAGEPVPDELCFVGQNDADQVAVELEDVEVGR